MSENHSEGTKFEGKLEGGDGGQKNQLVLEIHKALESPESGRELGKLMLENFGGEEYEAEDVLWSIREVYEEERGKRAEQVGSFVDFIGKFGVEVVMLVQRKMVQAGFDLGKFGQNKDGVDGKFGKVSLAALVRFFDGDFDPMAKGVKVENGDKNGKVSSGGNNEVPKDSDKHGHDHQHGDVRLEKRISPKSELGKEIDQLYAGRKAYYDLNNVLTEFGARDNRVVPENERFIRKFIIDNDPITGEKVSFLGRPLIGGINKHCYVFLKIAEEKIRQAGLNYVPMAKTIGGYAYREMKMISKKRSFVPSFHSAGLAIDIDSSNNGPKDGRGNIPDGVALALVQSGFTWGLYGRENSKYLGMDPMHFQLDVPADSAEGQAIINQSGVGKSYYDALFLRNSS